MAHGPASAEEIRRLTKEGGYAIPADLAIDGTSVFSALLVGPVRPPSENGMAGRLWWLADQLRTRQIEDLPWRDARDTRADPMTKGRAGRELILSAMDGQIDCDHDVVRCIDEKKKRTATSSPRSALAQN